MEREMLMTLQAQPGYLNSGKVRHQSQQQAVKQSYSNKLKSLGPARTDLAAGTASDRA